MRARRRRWGCLASGAPPSERTGTGGREWPGVRPPPGRSPPGCPDLTAAMVSSGKAAAIPETAPAAPARSPSQIRPSHPMKTSRPSEQVRPHRLEGGVGDLEAGEVRDRLAEALEHRDRDRIAGPGRELVHVEGHRGGRPRRLGQVAQQRGVVEGEVRAAGSRRPPPPRARPRGPPGPRCRGWTGRRSGPRSRADPSRPPGRPRPRSGARRGREGSPHRWCRAPAARPARTGRRSRPAGPPRPRRPRPRQRSAE